MTGAPAGLSSLSPEAVCRWIPVALGFFGSTTADVTVARAMLADLHRMEPEEFADAVRRVARAEMSRFGRVVLVGRLSECWDDSVARALAEVAREAKGPAVFDLLGDAVERAYSPASDVAQSLLSARSENDDSRSRAVWAAASLLRAADGSWPLLWPIFAHDREFGLDVLESASSESMAVDLGLGARLHEHDLALLFVWLEAILAERPPETPQPQVTWGRSMRTGHDLAFLQSAVLESLVNRGSSSACEELRALISEGDGRPWLRPSLERAEAIYHHSSWRGNEPSDIRALAVATHRRLVRTEGELFQVVLDTLNGVQDRLQKSPTPLVRFLWNESLRSRKSVRGRYPKYEADLSDLVAALLRLELQDRGVIINREVQITRGELTDIHVNVALSRGDGTFVTLTVIIEAKGCWNRRLDNDIAEQLVGRYLSGGTCKHGIYLVGWFQCDAWSGGDSRKKRRASDTLEDVGQRLRSRVEGLTTDEQRVAVRVLDCRWR
jgi:hypothetical protein